MKNIYLTFCALLCLFLAASAQVPNLNSYPSAKAVVFLDFDGHVVEGTSWNWDGPIYCDGSNLNATQLTEVFNRVAEDYRPFNINVTTDSTVYEAAPARMRTRVVLTTSSSWYGVAGGVAYTNSFTWGDNTPCFVFTALHKYNVKNISEAASHEIGHTLGLNHQSSYDATCNKTAEYNAGTGSGEIGWAPIMGVGYYRNVTLWHYGSNPFGCSYMQDDLGIITSNMNGFGFREDDFSNLPAAAKTVALANNKFQLNGVIERPNDADVFSFTLTGRSRFQLEALPYSVAAGFIGANVDMQVELVNSTGTQTAVYNPASSLKAAVDTVLSAGTWYLRVLSRGNTFAPDFASLGSYTVNASIASITLPLHKLGLKVNNENNRHKLDWDIVADEKLVEQVIESATDGTAFQPLAGVLSAARSHSYLPAKAAQWYYRLKVTFDNGRTYYSNIATLRSTGAGSKPYLVGNVFSSSMVINSPSPWQYTILDRNGRQVARGQLTRGQNVVSTGSLASGIYLIHFTNNREQYTEKFMQQ